MKKLLLALPLIIAACSDSGTEPGASNVVTPTFAHFPTSTLAGHYELWISFALSRDGGLEVRHSRAASAGKFVIDAFGQPADLDLSPIVFEIDPADSNARVDGDGNIVWTLAADAFVTLEAFGDTDDEPNLPGLLAGGFQNGRSRLDLNEADAIRVDLTAAAGQFVLATPTTADTGDDDEGAWFVDSGTGAAAGLVLPTITFGAPWTYAAWYADGAGATWALGAFTSPTGPDSDGAGPLGGTGFSFPGSDFPSGQMGMSLSTGIVFVTIEPPGDVDGVGPYLTILTAPVGGASPGTSVPLGASPLPAATVDIPWEG